MLLRELLVERGHGDADVERGARCPQRVVFVRHGDAERSHDRVARVLLHRAAVSRDRGRDSLEVALQDASERLRVERLGERHRLDDVDEEDRDEPAELHRRPGERSLLEQQRLVLAEDRGLELAELGAGIDAELLDERLARGAVGGERVGLAARAVEREHELRARPFAQRLGGDERLELGDELGVAPERKVGLDPLLERRRCAAPRAARSRSARTARRGSRRAPGRARARAPRGARPRPQRDPRPRAPPVRPARGGRSGGGRRARVRARARSPVRASRSRGPSALRSCET